MKRIFLGSIVGTIIFFIFQSAMWMGGFNDDFTSYAPQQGAVMANLSSNLEKDGLYAMPTVDPSSPTKKQDQEKLMKEKVGKPWAMVFYHQSMNDMEAGLILKGLLSTLLICLVVSNVIYNGAFSSFAGRFAVSMTFAVFGLAYGVFSQMNWWDFPWSFVKPQVMDLVVGWGLTSLALAAIVKRKDLKQ